MTGEMTIKDKLVGSAMIVFMLIGLFMCAYWTYNAIAQPFREEHAKIWRHIDALEKASPVTSYRLDDTYTGDIHWNGTCDLGEPRQIILPLSVYRDDSDDLMRGWEGSWPLEGTE